MLCGLLADRENNLVVGACWALHYLQIPLNVTCQALPSPIDLVVDDEGGAVTSPRDLSIRDVFVLSFACLESHVSIINVRLVQHVKFSAEDKKFSIFTCHGEILLVGSPRCRENAFR